MCNRQTHSHLCSARTVFYSKLANVDLSKKQEKPLDTNPKDELDPHAGHNHD